jgi:type III restriction enzyme
MRMIGRREMLSQDLDTLLKYGAIRGDVPAAVVDNLARTIELRPYQEEAIRRFRYYFEEFQGRETPIHLLFHMATGSGKTIVMAALILYLYTHGYRNFLFFVNSAQIVEKTKDNFVNPASPKYLFGESLRLESRSVEVREVSTFGHGAANVIGLHFSTIQGLHSRLVNPAEGGLSIEELATEPVVLLSDEAHHLNTETSGQLSKGEREEKRSWEGTARRLLGANPKNVLLEFTATLDLASTSIKEKYEKRVLFDYDLRQFRADRYSKEIELRQADVAVEDRMFQAILISQCRRKIAQRQGIPLKPVILMKSRTIKESAENEGIFRQLVDNLSAEALEHFEPISSSDATLARALEVLLGDAGASRHEVARELRTEFAREKTVNVNSPKDLERRQVDLNNLEARENEIRVVFAVDKLNEGWDVLNLFDIVRLYNTRDGRSNSVGKSTMQEAQLIGRGARYCPFVDDAAPELPRALRKYDRDTGNDLRLLEELHYHCAHNPSYIQDIKLALAEVGLLGDDERRVPLRVKQNFRDSEFYAKGFFWANRRIDNRFVGSEGLASYSKSLEFTYPRLFSGAVSESPAFENAAENIQDVEVTTCTIGISDIGYNIVRHSMDSRPFYELRSLKTYFPQLSGVREFLSSESYLASLRVSISGPTMDMYSLPTRTRMEIAGWVLGRLETQITSAYVSHVGSKEFWPIRVRDVLQDKEVSLVGAGENSRSWAQSLLDGLSLIDLKSCNWHVYDECYGTDQEKRFLQFLAQNETRIREKYSEFFVVRNERMLRVFAFEDGRAFEPDYLLILRSAGGGSWRTMQVFAEPKGPHLADFDEWKSQVLEQVSTVAHLAQAGSGGGYSVTGLPFFKQRETIDRSFLDAFDELLS